jgi:LmbE family N-acetylglucosaminyl deacetylase
VASQIVYDAAFLAGLKSYRPDLGAAFRPFKLLYALAVTDSADVAPTFVVDVTAHWKTKLAAIAAFKSQFVAAAGETVPLALDLFHQAIELHARRQGQRIRVEFGEGFVTKETISLDDLSVLTVSSF